MPPFTGSSRQSETVAKGAPLAQLQREQLLDGHGGPIVRCIGGRPLSD
jgi:hypothetical protein